MSDSHGIGVVEDADTDAINVMEPLATAPSAEAIMDALSAAWVLPTAVPFGQWYRFRATCDRHLTTDEAWKVAGCIGYALRQFLQGDRLSEPVIRLGKEWNGDHRTELYFDYNSAYCRRKHVAEAFEAAAEYVVNGSPVRVSDRAGVGTCGTRLCDGIGRIGIIFHVQAEW